jgi:hypothetical protein
MPTAFSIRPHSRARAIAAADVQSRVDDGLTRRLADVAGFAAGLIIAAVLVAGLKAVIAESAIASDPPLIAAGK